MIEEGELTNVRELCMVLNLPDLDGVPYRARLNWIQDFGDGFYRAGLEYCDSYPYDWGGTIWALRLDKEKKEFVPLFNAMID